jgi:PAS domain S-box-containing protein
MDVHGPMLVGFYDYRFVALSVLIAVLAAYAALDLAGRVTRAHGPARTVWLAGGAIAMGIGIWAMHYVGMEAYRLPVPVMYDWPTVLLSLFAAVLASGVALYTVSRRNMGPRRMTVGGVIMGCGIAAMHYIGMEAMRLPAMCMYSPWLVGLSVALAIVISFVALSQTFRFRETRNSGGWQKLCSAVLMGLAIPTMHYVGMAAVYFVPRSSVTDHDAVSVTNIGLACIVVATLVALALVFISSTVDRRISAQSEQFAEDLNKFQAVFDNLADAVVVVDIGHGMVRHNHAASKLLGIEGQTISLQGIADAYEGFSPAGELLRPDQWPIMQAMHGVYCNNTEVTIRRKDTGASVTTEISTAPVAASADGSPQIIVTLRDITERKAMIDRRLSLQARRFEDRQAPLRTVFDNMTEAILVVDSDRKVVLHNRAATELLGIGVEPLFLQGPANPFESFSPTGELLPPDQWPSTQALHGVYCKGREVTVRKRDSDASLIAEVSTAPIAISGEGSTQVMISLRDVTERKQLDDARNRLAAIVESSEDAIISKSDRGIVNSWNRGAEKLFGYTAAEMLGHSIKRLLPDDRQREEDNILQRIRQGETVDHFETVRLRKNGELVQVSLTISPIKDAEGKIIGASKIARNITERKQLQNQLYQSQKMEAIGQLTGGIAHDFNNLLGIILGNLDLLEMLVEDTEGALKRVQTAQTAATRGADLIRRLMAFSSDVELKAASTSLNHSVSNLIDWAPALGPDIEIVTHFDDSIPPVFVDDAGLESALLNLAVNARDAMPKGGTLTIRTQLSTLEETYPPVRAGDLKPGRYACVSMSDNGEGMSRETLEHVFEPFFTTKPRGKGTGLGLAMVYGFVKQSGGTVRIYSEVGYGTTVSLYLPLAEEVTQSIAAGTQSAPATKLKGTVLVVDDEVDLLEIAKNYLEDMGYKAYHAEDGASALAVVEQHKDIDLVVTDVLMPGGMNGVELAEKIRESLHQIKVIYCSGFPANALAERNMSLVDGPLLHKPYQRAEFGSVVRAVMEK